MPPPEMFSPRSQTVVKIGRDRLSPDRHRFAPFSSSRLKQSLRCEAVIWKKEKERDPEFQSGSDPELFFIPTLSLLTLLT
jgi:hypothetical protein